MTTPPTGTVDITNVVSDLKSSFVKWAVAYTYGLEVAMPGMEWVALPILSTIDQMLLKEAFTILANSLVMEAFFINTAIRKYSQAQDYVNAVSAKLNLPATASLDQYAKLESAEMVAFRNFVMLTN